MTRPFLDRFRLTAGLAITAVVVALGVTAAVAHSYRLGDIMIGHVWAPPSEKGAEGLPVYGPLLNQGKAVARLEGASSPLATRVRFRIDKDGKVSWPKSIELVPGRPVGLAAWHVHIWLSGLKRPVKDGDSFDLTLDFGKAGRKTVKVLVEKSPGH